MKTEISRDSFQALKRYSGVYQQQGRMLTDADWNELVDILKLQLDEALKDVVGIEQGSMGGTPRHRALGIVEDSGIKIKPGYVYVDGQAALLPGESNLSFDAQPDFPEPELPQGNHCLYVDVWERTITHLQDSHLRDAGLHGADTCTRKEVLAQIKWCPSAINPESDASNPRMGNAELSLSIWQNTVAQDPCDPCAVEINVAFIGNYLFRVEVHDVIGDANDPDEIILKWSSENASEQYLAMPTEDELPEGFISDQWVYEFFDQTSERHLGVHLNNTGWQPARGSLKQFGGSFGGYSVPAIPGSSESQKFVRRWDGYCRINIKTGTFIEGADRGLVLDPNEATDALGFIDIGTELEINLDALHLSLQLNNREFVAGDFWLAEVRDEIHSEGSVLLNAQLPRGIKHNYLYLATVMGGVLQNNPELDRKYKFPALTELTRMSIAGGDGQQAMAGHSLLQPLRINIANGEWPVSGAKVRLQIESGGGQLQKPSFVLAEHFQLVSANEAIIESNNGECASLWQLGLNGEQRIKVTLLGSEEQTLAHPPLYFYAQLNHADNVAYTPQCNNPAPTVNSLLDADGNINWPGLDAHGHTTVKHALDTLLCRLNAEKLPYDPSVRQSCWQEISPSAPQTVQQALDLLACHSDQGCCSITIAPGDDIADKLSAINDGQDAEICFKRGLHKVEKTLELVNKGNIVIHGCGASTKVLAPNSECVVRVRQCASLDIKDLALQSSQSGDSGEWTHLAGALDVIDVPKVSVKSLTLSCPSAVTERSASCLRILNTNKSNPTFSASVRDCHLYPGHRQLGVLLVNAHRALVEDNVLRVRKKSKKLVLKDQLKDKAFRDGIRNVLISNLSFSKTSSVSNVKRNASVKLGDKTVHFATDPQLIRSWQTYFSGSPPLTFNDDNEIIDYIKKRADDILLAQGQVDNIPAFSRWYVAMASSLPNIADQAVVCSGESAVDIRILNNSLYGVAQGIHVGLSHAKEEGEESASTDMAGRVQIRGNHITCFLSAEHSGERHGVFVGNCKSLDVDSNFMLLEKYPVTKTRAIAAIKVVGFLGKLILIRNNHAENFMTGAFVHALNSDISGDVSAGVVWQVVSNMLDGVETQLDVEPVNQFLIEHNA